MDDDQAEWWWQRFSFAPLPLRRRRNSEFGLPRIEIYQFVLVAVFRWVYTVRHTPAQKFRRVVIYQATAVNMALAAEWTLNDLPSKLPAVEFQNRGGVGVQVRVAALNSGSLHLFFFFFPLATFLALAQRAFAALLAASLR